MKKYSILMIYANAVNCYNKVTHSIVSLRTQYFYFELIHLVILFKAIQTTKILLRTYFGVSNALYTKEGDRLFEEVA